jgi:hypothetical protein
LLPPFLARVPPIALTLLRGKTFLLITWSIIAAMLGESGLVRSTGMSRNPNPQLPLYARQCGCDQISGARNEHAILAPSPIHVWSPSPIHAWSPF